MDFKDVTIGQHEYRIGRFTPKTGSWVVAQLLPKLIPCLSEKGLDVSAMIKALPKISEKTLDRIQDHCLNLSQKYNPEHIPVPVYSNGRVVLPELQYDTPAIMAITVQVLVFNLAPFFTGDGLQMILASVAGLNL